MKRAFYVLVAIIVFALAIVPGCETDEAVTGIRIQNNTGLSIMEVRIVPSGTSFVVPDQLSSDIIDGDYRDFETPAGLFDVKVGMDNKDGGVSTFTNPDNPVTVVEGQVSVWKIDPPS